MGKLKLLMKKSTKGEIDKSQRNRANFSTRNQNMQEVYDQVIDEDPEMEEYLYSSDSEGIAESEECIKSPRLHREIAAGENHREKPRQGILRKMEY